MQETTDNTNTSINDTETVTQASSVSSDDIGKCAEEPSKKRDFQPLLYTLGGVVLTLVVIGIIALCAGSIGPGSDSDAQAQVPETEISSELPGEGGPDMQGTVQDQSRPGSPDGDQGMAAPDGSDRADEDRDDNGSMDQRSDDRQGPGPRSEDQDVSSEDISGSGSSGQDMQSQGGAPQEGIGGRMPSGGGRNGSRGGFGQMPQAPSGQGGFGGQGGSQFTPM